MDYNFLKIEKPEKLEEVYTPAGRGLIIPDSVDKTVVKIINKVRSGGDRAVIDLCGQFDRFKAESIDDIKVKDDEIKSAFRDVKNRLPGLVEALEASYKNITRYHTAQFKREAGSWTIRPGKGKQIGQVLRPLERVGIYIPGGRYIYPSTVLMTVIPAIVAGVGEIIICTPPRPDGNINQVLLYLFGRLKVRKVYKIGGAQAVAVMAYGTESIKKVDKIVGPGNIYVTTAKKKVFGDVGIDGLAGPSDITVLADDTASPEFIAADLIAQAEHDPDSRSILLTTSLNLAKRAIEEIYRSLKVFKSEYGSESNCKVILSSLKNNCRVIFNRDKDWLIGVCNVIAPEHLEIMTVDDKKILKRIKNAGAIFMGRYCPVAAGDYISGTNHVIPTGGNARFSSPLGVYDFLKRSSTTFYDRDALKKEKKFIETISGFEKLFAHGDSIKIRFKKR
jgi:histidinol dehydrogenase